MHTGRSPSIRQLQTLMGYKSPRSVTVILKRLMNKGVLKRKENGSLLVLQEPEAHSSIASTVNIPLIGTVACGAPLLSEEHIQARIPVSVNLAKPPHHYFILRANGDSMNEAGIEDGDFILVRQQVTASDGEIVVALIDEEATVKRMRIGKDAIMLEPCSNNAKHAPIILQKDFQVQGIVVRCLGKLFPPQTE